MVCAVLIAGMVFLNSILRGNWTPLIGRLFVFASSFMLLSATARGAFIDKADLTNDLVVELAGDSDQTFVIAREALYDMGARLEPVYIPYLDKTLNCTVLPLKALMDAYPKFDTAIAFCYDGYISYYTPEFIAEYEPYIVLDLEGNVKGDMQLEGAPDLGPFYITFAKPLKQGSSEMPDPDNKRPFGVYKLELGTRESLVGALYAGPFADLNHDALEGRELWLHNCMSCHAWDQEGPGGNLSNRTAQIVAIHGRYNKKYFYDFIRDPSTLIPDVKMPKHPHYDDEKIENIRQFLLNFPE
jgi:cytochrome c2